MNQGTLILHIFLHSIFCYNCDIKNDFLKNIIGSEYILIFVIVALNSLYCGGVCFDVLKTILTAL
jgi:hypothetical protein